MKAFVTLILGLVASGQASAITFFHPHPAATPPLPSDQSGAPLRIPILIYHAIATDTPKLSASQEVFSTDPGLLADQLTFIDEHGYTTVTMAEVADMLRRGTTAPISRPVALTFDDGWVTQYRNALPLLKEHHAKATFYIFPHPIGIDDRFMTWDQIKEVRDAGMEIGSHSMTHPYFSKLSREQMHKEMYESKQVLEKELGVPIVSFAAPFGYTSTTTVEELQQIGYASGRTTDRGMIHAATSTYALTGYIVHKGMKDFAWALEHAK